MKKILIAIVFTLTVGVFFAFSHGKKNAIAASTLPTEQIAEVKQLNDDNNLPPSNADFKEFIELAQEVYEYRKDRLPNL